jgi:hypothetical protein
MRAKTLAKAAERRLSNVNTNKSSTMSHVNKNFIGNYFSHWILLGRSIDDTT